MARREHLAQKVSSMSTCEELMSNGTDPQAAAHKTKQPINSLIKVCRSRNIETLKQRWKTIKKNIYLQKEDKMGGQEHKRTISDLSSANTAPKASGNCTPKFTNTYANICLCMFL